MTTVRMLEPIETEHLRLIPFALELMQVALIDKNRLAQMLGVRVPDSWPGEDLAEALPFFIQMMEQHPEAGTWDGLILHKADHVLIGGMGFKDGPDEHGMVEIGYSIIPEYQRRGYATEMARALIAWVFSNPDISVVTAECLDDNIGSIRVLEKVGMRRLEPEGNMLKWEIGRES